MNKLDIKKLMWNHMLKNGCLTDGKWNYYGANWEGYYDFTKKKWEHVIKEIKSIGVNWDKTEVPKSKTQSTFEGTEADSGTAESLLGTIVLNNNNQYMIGVGNSHMSFDTYARMIADINDLENSKNEFGF